MKTHPLETKIPPPVLCLLTGVAMWGLNMALPGTALPGIWRIILPVLTGIAAISFATPAFFAFGKAKTTIDPVHVDRAAAVVSTGIYSITRNPMYVALTLLLVAWALWLSVPWTLAAPLLFALYLHRFQIIPEERAMLARFGREYAEYRERVRRWL